LLTLLIIINFITMKKIQKIFLVSFLALALVVGVGASQAGATLTLGVLTIDSSGALNLGTSTATSLSVGATGITTTNNGALTVTQLFTASANAAVTGTITGTSAGASALAVGRQGATNPALQVDASTATSLTGLKITAAGTGAGLALAVVETGGTNNNLTIDAMGSGTITLGGTSTGNIITTRAITPTGGVAAAGGFTTSARLVHTGGIPAQVSTDGTDATPVNTEVYIAEVFVPANMTVTGVAVMNGSVASGNIKVGLADSTGAVVATSASTSMAGTDAYQRIAFTGTYAAKGPATYYVLEFVDNNTARINTHTFGNFGAAKQTGQVYATGFTTITPPTTFTTALAPIASLY
jgi:hypothetical protein